MVNKKKIVLIGGVSAVAAVALVAGSFAFFTDTAEQQTGGTAGQVSIDVAAEMNLTNRDNINPGDNDPNNNDTDARAGTPHELTFAIDNTANKSIMMRNVITLSVLNQDGTTVMDPSVYSLLYDGKNELVAKYYSSDGVNFSSTKPENCTHVRYITTQVALNGIAGSTGREVEEGLLTGSVGNGATVDEDGDSVSFLYTLALDHNTEDMYELSHLTIDLEVQAMQYRNTSDDIWDVLYTETVTTNSASSDAPVTDIGEPPIAETPATDTADETAGDAAAPVEDDEDASIGEAASTVVSEEN